MLSALPNCITAALVCPNVPSPNQPSVGRSSPQPSCRSPQVSASLLFSVTDRPCCDGVATHQPFWQVIRHGWLHHHVAVSSFFFSMEPCCCLETNGSRLSASVSAGKWNIGQSGDYHHMHGPSLRGFSIFTTTHDSNCLCHGSMGGGGYLAPSIVNAMKDGQTLTSTTMMIS